MRPALRIEPMTVAEAIARTDALKPNGYSYAQKIAWLSTLDGAVTHELINTHEGGEWVGFEPYADAVPPDTPLLIPAPFDETYLRYLEAQIDYANGEFDRFNNSNAMYAAAYSAFANYYNRTHIPCGKKRKYY